MSFFRIATTIISILAMYAVASIVLGLVVWIMFNDQVIP